MIVPIMEFACKANVNAFKVSLEKIVHILLVLMDVLVMDYVRTDYVYVIVTIKNWIVL
jgi:hypothetical protein